MGPIYLLSCVARKWPSPAPARDLYVSAWFQKASSYAVRTGLPWFVLSAKYGLVHPDEVLAPYELTLNTMPVTDRRRWASRVLAQMEPRLEGINSVVFLAGLRYREFLAPALQRLGVDVSVPMERLRNGEQLKWLTRELSS